MGHWDELCLLCAISPIPPSEIYTDTTYGVADLTEKIVEYDPLLLSDLQLDEDGLRELLENSLELDLPFDKPEWRWEGFTTCIAIGHFLVDGDTPHQLVKTASGYMRRIPDGMNVETRVVRDTSCGEFNVVVKRSKNQENKVVEVEEPKLSRTSSSNYLYSELQHEDGFGNFFLSEGCFHYLQAWIDYSRLGVSCADPLSFSGELYEVVNSRKTGRVNAMGILPWMDYDGVEDTLEQTQYEFEGGLKIPRHTSTSIRKDGSPEDMLDAIIRDCGCWRFIAPDLWPSSPVELRYESSKFSMTLTAADPLTLLPNEILFNILRYVDSLRTCLSVARTSRSIYNTVTEDSLLSLIIKEMSSAPSGCLFWLRPVSSMPGEIQKAYWALSTLLPKPSDPVQEDTNTNDESAAYQSLFARPDFPWISFVRTCYESDSMMNRKRIWGQVKQLEEIWREYRLHGWKVDRFGVPLEP